ncbi:MAG: hypothetical protein LJE68_13730 [Rhodobacter sp.]|nr:hypothetical protein [Rhodobacter sp.]
MTKPQDRDHQTYDEAVAGFDLEALEGALSGDLVRGVNPCVECCDRHAGDGRTALRFVSLEGDVQRITFDELAETSARMAHPLTEAGVADATTGALAVDVAHSPLLWFGGYLGQGQTALAGGYYRTGDTVEHGPDGTFSFVGRSDDVITSSRFQLGPFDVESALLEHPAVIEAAVVGVPDAARTELVKAFVVLRDPQAASDALAQDLKRHVKDRLAAHAFPRLVEFIEALPRTPSGKIQRILLRQAPVA